MEPVDIPAGYIEAISSLPKKTGKVVFDPHKVKCVCGARVDTRDCRVRFSGHVHYVEVLCASCRRDLADYGQVVCPRCRRLALLLKPSRDPRGFEIRKGGIYHVEDCPDCHPGVSKSPIIEKLLFYKRNGFPYEKPKGLRT